LKTAALAQKNSEAARALAMQSEILEKELGEIQKVLLAMQVIVPQCYLKLHDRLSAL
jgi:hypothetical protein